MVSRFHRKLGRPAYKLLVVSVGILFDGCRPATGRLVQEDSRIFTAAVLTLRDSIGAPLRVLASPLPGKWPFSQSSQVRNAMVSERSAWLAQNGFAPTAPSYEPCDGFLKPPPLRRRNGCPREHLVVAQLSLVSGRGAHRSVTVRVRNMYPYGASESLSDYDFINMSGRWVLERIKDRSIAE